MQGSVDQMSDDRGFSVLKTVNRCKKFCAMYVKLSVYFSVT
jgi:hypothetical protein